MNPISYLRNGYRWLVDPYGFLDEALERWGLTFHIHLPVLGRVLMTGEARLAAEIAHHKDLAGGQAVTALRAILGGRSLIMLDGEAHEARHRLIAPLFRGKEPLAYDELTIRLTREVLSKILRGKTFSMYAVLRRIGLKAMVAAMFGDDRAVAKEAEEKIAGFLNSFQNALILFFRPLRLDAGSWSPWGRALRNRRVLCEFIRRRIHAGQKSGRGPTILERLVAESAASNSMDEDDVVEEVLSLLLFGHDTAAATMAWAFAHIYRDGALVERIRCEPADGRRDAAINPDSLPFLEACIKESMRLCPVVVHLARTATVDVRLADFQVRRGQKVIPCTYLAHHNAEVFPEPYAFRPERFLNDQRYEHAYYPFGFGSRTCVGRPFAMRQMLLVISTAVRSMDLELAPDYQATPARHLVLVVPRSGPPMRLRNAWEKRPVPPRRKLAKTNSFFPVIDDAK